MIASQFPHAPSGGGLQSKPEEPSATEILRRAEVCAGFALVMAPIIWWLQGPSVSADQFVARAGMTAVSACAAVGATGRKLVARWRARRRAGDGRDS